MVLYRRPLQGTLLRGGSAKGRVLPCTNMLTPAPTSPSLQNTTHEKQLRTLMETVLLPSPKRTKTELPNLMVVAHADDEVCRLLAPGYP